MRRDKTTEEEVAEEIAEEVRQGFYRLKAKEWCVSVKTAEVAVNARLEKHELPSTFGPSPIYCSFCNKSQYEVTGLLVGGLAFICNECAEVAVIILREQAEKKLQEQKEKEPSCT